jgi:hypothetical protein
MLVSALPPIVGVLVAPGMVGILLVGPVIRVGGHFGLLPPALPFTLTGGIATKSLVLGSWISRNFAVTARADKCLHHGTPPPWEPSYCAHHRQV